MIHLEQFIAGVPDGLAIWLKEKQLKSLTAAANLQIPMPLPEKMVRRGPQRRLEERPSGQQAGTLACGIQQPPEQKRTDHTSREERSDAFSVTDLDT